VWYFLGLGLAIVLLGSLWVLIDRFATGRAWWILVAVVDLLVIVGWVMLADRLWPGHPHRRRRRRVAGLRAKNRQKTHDAPAA
jgi:hypothetical protein